MNMHMEDWNKKVEMLRERAGSTTHSVSLTDDDVEFEFVRDEAGREIAIPKKSFRGRREDVWDRMRIAHPGLPALMNSARFSDFQKSVYDDLSNGFKNAVIFGSAGTGKTQIALAALKNLCMGARTVVAMRFTEIKRTFEPRQLEADNSTPLAVLHSLTDPEYLLIDEVGYGQTDRKYVPEHERQVLFDIVSERDAFYKHTWLTTNMTITTLEEVYGDATVSRLGKWDGCVKADFSKQPNYRYRRG